MRDNLRIGRSLVCHVMINTMNDYLMQYLFMSTSPSRPSSVSFLLAQLGAHAARAFAKRLTPLHLAPPHAGILRILNQSPALSQRELAGRLHMHTSRLVAIIDEMESLGLIVRQGVASDRRAYAIQITEAGRKAFAEIGRIGAKHEAALCASLSPEERGTLAALLQLIADEQGLTRGIHPGYQRLGGSVQGEDAHAQIAACEERPPRTSRR